MCCRSPIVPVRPTYSAELLTASFNGSLPRSSGASGSAPDLSHGGHNGDYRSDSRSRSPVTNVWTNPLLLGDTSSTFDGTKSVVSLRLWLFFDCLFTFF